MFRSFLAKIPRLQPYFLARIGSFSSLFILQSKSINFSFGHLSLIFGQNTKAIALPFGQNWLIFITFQSAITINQFQFRSFFAHFWPKFQGYSLTFRPTLAHFHHFSICNQTQSISFSVSYRSFFAKLPRLQPYLLANIGSCPSLFNLQSKSINFNFGHFSLNFRPKDQGYNLTFWPKLAHFHHFSICNQTQSISFSVSFRSFLAKLPRLQPYFLATIGSCPSLFNLQSNSINVNFGQFSLYCRPKDHGYNFPFWPKLAHFHHFSICNQNPSISIYVTFRSFLAKIPRLQPYFLAKIGSFSSVFNLQSNSINFNFGHCLLIFGQNTKAIALLFGQNWLIFITCQSAIKINQCQFWSFFA